MTDIAAEASLRIAAPPVAVWTILTDTARWPEFFLGARAETDWAVGAPIRLKGEFEGRAYEDKGEILTFEPGRRLAFSHWSGLSGAPDTPENHHVVTFDLAPSAQGTDVTLRQTNLTGGLRDADRRNRAAYEKNWRTVLAGLAKLAEAAGSLG